MPDLYLLEGLVIIDHSGTTLDRYSGGDWVEGVIIPAGISEVKPLKASTPGETGDPRPTPGPYGFEVLAQPGSDGP